MRQLEVMLTKLVLETSPVTGVGAQISRSSSCDLPRAMTHVGPRRTPCLLQAYHVQVVQVLSSDLPL